MGIYFHFLFILCGPTWKHHDDDLPQLDANIPGTRLKIKAVVPGYGDSYVKDKTVEGPADLLHGSPYAGKTTSLY